MSENIYPPGVHGGPQGHGGGLPNVDPSTTRKLRDVQRGGAMSGEAPAAELVQRGIGIQRMPDSNFQPEGGLPVRLSMQLRDCDAPITIWVATSAWVTILSYQVGAGRKLVIVDAALRWSNPYVSLITDTRLIVGNSELLGLKPRRQKPCGCPQQMKAYVYGPATVEFQIRHIPESAVPGIPASRGWNYGSIYAEMTGWDVDDKFPADMRIFK